MLAIYVQLQSLLYAATSRLAGRRPGRRRLGQRSPDQLGQTTAEYALVLLGAAAVAMLVVTWAARTDRVARLLDAVVDKVLSRV